MLSRDVLAVDIDARHWRGLLGLFSGAGLVFPPTLYLVMSEGRCVKAIHNKRGPILGLDFEEDRDPAERLLGEYGVERVALVDAALLRRFMHAWQSAFDPAADWDDQIRAIAEAAIAASFDEIRWRPSPPPRPRLPKPPSAGLLKWGWPDHTCVGLFVFDDKSPHTSLILGKRDGKIALMTTLDAFGLADGPLDRRTQREAVAELCARQFMPLHGALWIEKKTWDEMLAAGRPLTFLRLAERRGRAAIWPKPFAWRAGLALARRLRRL